MDFQFGLAAFVAGVLTILAPCILPVLPIILGGSAGENKRKAYVIAGSLGISIVAFTLVLRVFADSLNIPQATLNYISGSILIIFGLFTIFPKLWDEISIRIGLSSKSNNLMNKFSGGEGLISNSLLGASLGPVFTSCSPTYAAIIALVLMGEISNLQATIYTVIYALGLVLMLILIAHLGQKFIKKIGWATDPHGTFKRVVGVLFLLIGISIITGFDKKIERTLLEWGVYEPLAEFEDRIRN